MPAPSLVKIATDVCIANIRSITSVGDFEYWKIRRVLHRVESPEQLHQIEQNSPQIQGEDAELWQTFIARDIPNWKDKNYVPKNPKNWYLVYKRYKKEEREKMKQDEDRLREAMMGLKAQKESHVSKVVDAKFLPKLPRDPRMISHNGGVPLGRRRGLSNGPATSLTFGGGSRTKITDGRSLFTKVRREAREIASRGRLNTPQALLSQRSSKVTKAPAGMLKEHERAAAPVRIYTGKKRAGDTLSSTGTGSALEERERRLRAMKMGGSSSAPVPVDPKATILDFDEDEDDDEDDLFDEPPANKATPHKLRPGNVPPMPKQSDLVSLNNKGKTGQSTGSKRLAVESPESSPPPRAVVQKRKAVDIFHKSLKRTRT